MLQNPHARSHPVWGTLSHQRCMHCHSKHALQHSQQVLSVCESRGFCAMELLAPSPLAAGPGAVHIYPAGRRAGTGCLTLRQIPYPHPAPVVVFSNTQSPQP